MNKGDKEILQRFEDALLIVKTGKDSHGNVFNNIGKLNQAAWIGENSSWLIKKIKELDKSV